MVIAKPNRFGDRYNRVLETNYSGNASQYGFRFLVRSLQTSPGGVVLLLQPRLARHYPELIARGKSAALTIKASDYSKRGNHFARTRTLHVPPCALSTSATYW